jgi:metal-responsive CopG/Arc/MetJ family transcriptional regulator
MTVYDDKLERSKMRTIVEIPIDKIQLLDKLCLIQKISRAEMIRRAIDKMIIDTSEIRRQSSFGSWKRKKINSLKYEESLRSEWS